MAKQKDVTIVVADDWEGLYVDGKLICEDSALLHFADLLSAVRIKYDEVDCDEDWFFDYGGRLPDKLEDVVLYGTKKGNEND